jgi:hypothetical protein
VNVAKAYIEAMFSNVSADASWVADLSFRGMSDAMLHQTINLYRERCKWRPPTGVSIWRKLFGMELYHWKSESSDCDNKVLKFMDCAHDIHNYTDGSDGCGIAVGGLWISQPRGLGNHNIAVIFRDDGHMEFAEPQRAMTTYDITWVPTKSEIDSVLKIDMR